MNRKFLLLLLGGLLSLPAWAIQYRYDELHRLTQVLYDNGASIDYGYDPAGNIVSIARIAGSGVTPGAPTLQRAVGGNGSMKLFFLPPTETGGQVIVSYTVTCTPTNGGTAVSATGTASPITVTGLTNRTLYTCSLHASNTAGSGTQSTAVSKKAGPPSIAPILTIILD